MIGYGLITTPDWPDTSLDREAWLAFRDAEPTFRPLDELPITNPFTKEDSIVQVPGSADVIQDGKLAGRFFWEDGRIYVDGDPEILTPLARICADALRAQLQDEDGTPL